MSKQQHPGSFDLTSQMDDRETFEVFEQVFPRVLAIENFVYPIQRMCVDEGPEFTDLLVELCKEYGVSAAVKVAPESRRTFFAVLIRRWEVYQRDYPSHNGECC